MTLSRAVAVPLLVALAAPAAAQLSNRSIALETCVSRPFQPGSPPSAGLALSATSWLDGEVEAIARVSWAAAAEPAGRAAAGALSGTAGLRVSLAPDPLRPQLFAEAGWVRTARGGAARDALAFAIGAGLEWFAARDLSASARAAVRGTGTALAGELVLALSAYF